MSRGTGGAVLAPAVDGGAEASDSDARLVAAVRLGDDRAFEALYQRYQRRIHAYVLGMVKDHGRAEDVTQEVFVSALRRMRATDRPIAFKPWVYEIAKNACIDAFRRSRRAEEVSYDAEEGLAPADHSRLASPAPGPEAALSAKHDLETLCGAFGGLSEAHHRILVLRELEGLSYDEIGARMGMTRPAVESTLFRARRRLSEEYEELVSGARCMRVQSIIAAAVEGAVGVRDSRRLARHLAHCQPCRREALAAGLDRGLLVRRPAVERAARRVAAFLPLPAFLRLRRGVSDAALSGSSGSVSRAAAHLPAVSEQPWGRAAAGVAILIAGVGTGVGVHHSGGGHPGGASKPAAVTPASHVTQSSPAAAAAAGGASVTAPASSSSRSGGRRGAERHRSSSSSSLRQRGEIQGQGPAAGRATSPGGGPSATPAPTSSPSSSSPSSGGDASKASNPASHGGSSSGGGGGGSSSSGTPTATGGGDPAKPVAGAVQQTTQAAQQTVQNTTSAVDQTVHNATSTVQSTTQQVTDGVDRAVQGATGGGPVAGTVQRATGAVDDTVSHVGDTVDHVADGATNAVNGLTGGLLGGRNPTG